MLVRFSAFREFCLFESVLNTGLRWLRISITLIAQTADVQLKRWLKGGIFIASYFDSHVINILRLYCEVIMNNFLYICSSAQNEAYWLYIDVDKTNFLRHMTEMSTVIITFKSQWFHIMVSFRSQCY